tara:strand:- start:6083 stop:6505 length:423 start_codon:yes stop_codon:yes gene_type:complete
MALATTPQITASLSLSSPNITNDAIALSVATKLNKAATSDTLDQTTGVSRKFYSGAQTNTLLLNAAEYTDNKAHKVYIKNTSSSPTDYILVKVGATELGYLYAGDWLFMPWGADTTSTNADIDIDTNGSATVEYAVFYEA